MFDYCGERGKAVGTFGDYLNIGFLFEEIPQTLAGGRFVIRNDYAYRHRGRNCGEDYRIWLGSEGRRDEMPVYRDERVVHRGGLHCLAGTFALEHLGRCSAWLIPLCLGANVLAQRVEMQSYATDCANDKEREKQAKNEVEHLQDPINKCDRKSE